MFASFYASHSYEADTIAAMFIAILICVTMYPLSVHCAMVLLQAGPKEIMSSIDKCLKEEIRQLRKPLLLQQQKNESSALTLLLFI